MGELGSYNCKKWTLFSLALVGIVVTLIVTIVACKLIGDMEHPPAGSGADYEKNWKDIKKVAIGIIVAIGVISILFHLLGVCGAYKEHYCMTLTYAILMTLGTLATIGSATRAGGGANWGSFVVNLLVTILAYVFAHDIKVKQRGGHHGGYA